MTNPMIMSTETMTPEEFERLGREWEGAEYAANAMDDPEERERAHNRCIEIERLLDNAPYEYDGEGRRASR